MLLAKIGGPWFDIAGQWESFVLEVLNCAKAAERDVDLTSQKMATPYELDLRGTDALGETLKR
ncbi:MAG: hypothetical protein F9B45_21870 [Phycisphaera sp. RhM]|nr:hypothetical protein [Phycisphaera sp. RhM]